MGEADTDRPNTYRIYDYLLGGSFNFKADRAFAKELLERLPWAREVARHNRAFLNRAVRFCVAGGVGQFLDLGSGIPTVGRVDQVARMLDPDSRVVYVDADELAVAHAEVLLDGQDGLGAARADLRDVERVLSRPAVTRVLDLDRPVALLMGAVVHFMADADDPAGVIAGYRDALAPGSALVLSHATYEDVPGEVAKAAPLYRRTTQAMVDRSRAGITALFDGWEIVEPGVVFTTEWRPDYPPESDVDPGRAVFLGGVGRRR